MLHINPYRFGVETGCCPLSPFRLLPPICKRCRQRVDDLCRLYADVRDALEHRDYVVARLFEPLVRIVDYATVFVRLDVIPVDDPL